jgi:NO-binding membrane sensor protein with MHYT domain
MPSAHAIIATAFGLLPYASAWGACFAGWFVAFELLKRRSHGRTERTGLIVAAGVAGGAGVWAHPCLAGAWPDAICVNATGSVVAFAVIVAAASTGFAVERFFRDARGLIGGGAILGAGVALSHFAVFLALRGPVEVNVDDMPVAGAVALASGLAVLGFAARRRHPGNGGQLAAVVCLTAATSLSQIIGRFSLIARPDAEPVFDPVAIPIADMTVIAGLVLVAALTALTMFDRSYRIRRATRAPA